MRNAILPHPLLSVILAAVWVLLANEFSTANILLGVMVGLAVPKITSRYWPGRPRIRHPLLIAEYLAVVLYDIVVSNVQVARLVLFRGGNDLQSHFVRIPLDLRSPEGIWVLAGTITMTPGTLTADVSPDQRYLLVHCLDVTDKDERIADIKSRYEQRLQRIFP
jgi:multicomponent K+:H+ antiporter subunit E